MAAKKQLTQEEREAAKAEDDARKMRLMWECPKCAREMKPVMVDSTTSFALGDAAQKVTVAQCPGCLTRALVGPDTPFSASKTQFNAIGEMLVLAHEIVGRLNAFEMHISGSPNPFIELARLNGMWSLTRDIIGTGATDMMGLLFPACAKMAACGEVSVSRFEDVRKHVNEECGRYSDARAVMLNDDRRSSMFSYRLPSAKDKTVKTIKGD